MEKHNQSQYIKMTQTPVLPLITSLSVPTILSMLVTNIYNLADTAFVGQLGTAASGAVGIVFGYMAIIQAAGFMFGQGAGSIMARLLGARRVADAEKTASTAFFCSMISGGLIGLVSLVFLDPVVRVLGSTETIAPYARTYILFIIASAPLMTASFTMNNLLRYDGKASLGMIGLMTGAIMNMAGDPILIFGFKLGIAGAGLSTALSQAVSFCILLSMFLRGKTTVGISWKKEDHGGDLLEEGRFPAGQDLGHLRHGLSEHDPPGSQCSDHHCPEYLRKALRRRGHRRHEHRIEDQLFRIFHRSGHRAGLSAGQCL